MTRAHFANLAPELRYSTSARAQAVRPSVTTSPALPASGVVPLSNLMPG